MGPLCEELRRLSVVYLPFLRFVMTDTWGVDPTDAEIAHPEQSGAGWRPPSFNLIVTVLWAFQKVLVSGRAGCSVASSVFGRRRRALPFFLIVTSGIWFRNTYVAAEPLEVLKVKFNDIRETGEAVYGDATTTELFTVTLFIFATVGLGAWDILDR